MNKQWKSSRSWYSPHPVSPKKHHRPTRAVSHLGSDMFAECCTRPQYVPRLYCETGRSRFPGSEDVILTGCKGVGTAIEARQASTARGFARMSVRVGKCVGRDDIGDNAKRELATSAIAAIGTFHPWICHFYISTSILPAHLVT